MILPVLAILFAHTLIEKVSSSRTYKLPGYDFSYDVFNPRQNQDFGHAERRHLDYTEGEYYVLLPDGRKQVVSYYANENGYFPTVTYIQEGSETVLTRLRATSSPKNNIAKGDLVYYPKVHEITSSPKNNIAEEDLVYFPKPVPKVHEVTSSPKNNIAKGDLVYFPKPVPKVHKVTSSPKNNIARGDLVYFPKLVPKVQEVTSSPKNNIANGDLVYFPNLVPKVHEDNKRKSLATAISNSLNIKSGNAVSSNSFPSEYERVHLKDQSNRIGGDNFATSRHGSTHSPSFVKDANFYSEPNSIFIKADEIKYSSHGRSQNTVNINKYGRSLVTTLSEPSYPVKAKNIEKQAAKFPEYEPHRDIGSLLFNGNLKQRLSENVKPNQFSNFNHIAQPFNKTYKSPNNNIFVEKEARNLIYYSNDNNKTTQKFNNDENLYLTQRNYNLHFDKEHQDSFSSKTPSRLSTPSTALGTKSKAQLRSNLSSKLPQLVKAKQIILKQNTNVFPADNHPNFHQAPNPRKGNLQFPILKPKYNQEITSNAISKFQDMNINPDDSVVPNIVPVIIPVEGDLGNSVFKDFELYDIDYNGGASNSFGDYYDDDYL